MANVATPLKTNIETKNDGLEHVLSDMAILGSYVDFRDVIDNVF